MEWTDNFDPISEVSGNIEITFNSKNKDFDPYEEVKDQLVVTIGKSGRANRLTFERPNSQELVDAAKALTEIANELRKLEEEMHGDDESQLEDDDDRSEDEIKKHAIMINGEIFELEEDKLGRV